MEGSDIAGFNGEGRTKMRSRWPTSDENQTNMAVCLYFSFSVRSDSAIAYVCDVLKCTIHISLAAAEETGNTNERVWYIGVIKQQPHRIGRFSLAALTGKKRDAPQTCIRDSSLQTDANDDLHD